MKNLTHMMLTRGMKMESHLTWFFSLLCYLMRHAWAHTEHKIEEEKKFISLLQTCY